MQANLNEMKQGIEKAKEELTKAKAVMGEIEKSIEKEILDLKECGVDIPERGSDDGEFYNAVLDAARKKAEELQKDLEEGMQEIEAILKKWSDVKDEKDALPF